MKRTLKEILKSPKPGDKVKLFDRTYVFGRHDNWWYDNCYFVNHVNMVEDFELGHVTRAKK